MTEEQPPKTEDLTPEVLDALAEKQRMKLMGIKPKSNAEVAITGTANAAATTYRAGCGLMTIGSILLGLLLVLVIPPVGIAMILLGIVGLLIRR